MPDPLRPGGAPDTIDGRHGDARAVFLGDDTVGSRDAARVFLNIDLGELRDEPEGLYGLAHIANIACGGHAGDEASMRRALALCDLHGARAGAHPSYPDRAGFGRSRIAMSPAQVRSAVAAQCRVLADLAASMGVPIRHAKAHGALYHAANDDDAIAEALVGGVRDALGPAITALGPPRGELAAACARAGLALIAEGFADRGTRADGSLVPRGEPGALITDPTLAAVRTIALIRSRTVGTVCVHGDTPGAMAIARAVREVLDREASVPVPLGDGALLFPVPTSVDPRALENALRALPRVLDAVVTDRDACVRFDDAPPDIAAALSVARSASSARDVRVHTIRVRYDGTDLDEVAGATGLSRNAVIALHTSVEYVVQSVGFMPGFAYLGDLPPPLRLPRRTPPRVNVPAGSVAIAGARTGIYPFDSPGGWHLLGVALDFVAFDPARGATLQLGDRVRFEAAP